MQRLRDNRWLRRFRAIFLGFVIGILVLEALLRVAGLAISLADDHQRDTASDGSRRVLCLGACYTIGLGSDPDESYPAQLQTQLEERYPDDPVAVINGGVRGKSVDYFSEQIEVILDETEPDVVVLNVNDRLRYKAEELSELKRAESSFWLSGLQWLGDYSVLARVILLAVEGPSEDTGMPEEWWEQRFSEPFGQDVLTSQLTKAQATVKSKPGDVKSLLKLAHAYERRSDHSRAVLIFDRVVELEPHKPEHYLRRAEARIMLRDFQGAWEDLSVLPTQHGSFHDFHWAKANEALDEKDAQSTWVHRFKRLSLYYATWGKTEKSQEFITEVQQRRPGTAWAHDFADFYTALMEAQESGGPVLNSLPTADALFERMVGGDVELGARYGLFEEDGVERSVDTDEAAQEFEMLLRHHLERIKRATDERDIRLIVENMSSRPEQQQVLEEICADLNIPLVPLQEGLAAHAERDQLLHESQSLRLSTQGNAFMAEEIFPYVVTALEE
jgi:tetratricopeptide (TPR) repeat protein